MIPPPPGQQPTAERGDVWVDVFFGRRRSIDAIDEAAS